MVAWADNLEEGLDIDTVKKSQPDYLEIDWESPVVIGDEKWYLITEIEGSRDLIGMQNFLIFKGDEYMGRESKK